MRLRILLPTKVLANEAVVKVTADGTHGNFAILPRHVDFLAALVPGLLSFERVDGGERFAAVDGGLLVKHGSDVFVPARRAVVGDDLQALRLTVEREFLAEDERERHARSAMARLEANFIRRFMELEGRVRA
jgi:F-type H+-transporting ATPase subunit epsilon